MRSWSCADRSEQEPRTMERDIDRAAIQRNGLPLRENRDLASRSADELGEIESSATITAEGATNRRHGWVPRPSFDASPPGSHPKCRDTHRGFGQQQPRTHIGVA